MFDRILAGRTRSPLPSLAMIDASRIFFDSHMHTPLCKHARGHPLEYAATGFERGLAGVIFTCHSPMPDGFSHQVRMAPEQFDEYRDLVLGAADEAPEGFEILLGMESDFFPGMEPWLTDLHRRADFHYILGSVHWHIREYIEAFWSGCEDEFRRQYFAHLAESAESGLFDALAHPDLIKNATPEAWNFEKVRTYIAEALDRIAETGVAMELNTSGMEKAYSEMNPGPEMLAMMAERGIPVVLGSDSHVPHRVGDRFASALDQFEEAGYECVSIFRERQRRDLLIEEVRESLAGFRLQPTN